MQTPIFPTDLLSIETRLEAIDPVAYGETRNYTDGTVTYLSPYISRGVISGRKILDQVFMLGYDVGHIEKLLQELAWREYYQRLWQAMGSGIMEDLPHLQINFDHHSLPQSIHDGTTGIRAIDEAIRSLLSSGYMHNHCRLYVSSVACNIAAAHWKTCSQWMYYHLLDADLASNTMGWKWVAGICNGKKYYANQENINRFTRTSQEGTFLDTDYESLAKLPVPEALRPHSQPDLKTALPASTLTGINPEKDTLIYTFYNIDPFWHAKDDVNRILLLEPSFFHTYPVSDFTMDFILRLAENIPGIKIFTGEYSALIERFRPGQIRYKEHPAFRHFAGIEESRDWIFPEVTGAYPSFFSYWKKCRKYLSE